MSVLNLYQQQVESEEPAWSKIFPGRSETIALLNEKKFCDVLVVGGGLHGLLFARLAALHGLRTVLLEKSDYGSGASGRGPCLLHAFGNYSEDSSILAALQRSRQLNELREICSHLMAPLAVQGAYPSILARTAAALLPWFSGFGRAYVLDQGLLLNESLIAARQEGVLCVNYVGLESLQTLNDGTLEIGWHDYRGSSNGDLRAGVVVNCTGAAVARVGRIDKSSLESKLRYARVLTLLFDTAWSAPAQVKKLFARRGRYSVFPAGSHTAVSLLSAECDEYRNDVVPREEELERALLAVERDCAAQGLNRDKLFYAGVSVRPLFQATPRGRSGPHAAKPRWLQKDNMLTLIAGDIPEILHTVYQGFCELARLTSFGGRIGELRGRRLPGSANLEATLSRLYSEARRRGASQQIVERLTARLGSCVRFLYAGESFDFEPITPQITKAEVDFALNILQIESFKDLMRRGLGLEYEPGYGLTSSLELFQYYKSSRRTLTCDSELLEYRGYLDKLKRLIASTA